MLWWCGALALAGGLPMGRLTLDVEAYGERLAGVILADTAALAPGVRLMKGTEPVSGRVANGDGEPQEGEVRPLGSLGIEWISRYGQVSFAERRTKVAP